MSAILRDLRFAVRALGRRRMFVVVAVTTIALGIGAATGARRAGGGARAVRARGEPGRERPLDSQTPAFGPPIPFSRVRMSLSTRCRRAIGALRCATLALIAAPAAAVAQSAAADTAKPLNVTAAIAYLDASGNTDVTSLSVTERLEWKRPHYLWAQFVNVINGTTDGEESANLFAAGVRGDWKPRGRLSLYGLVNYDRNRFANIGRRFEEGLGLSYMAIDRPKHRLTSELGGQFVQQRDLDGVSDDFLAGRVAELYRFTFRENAYFEERVEYLPNLETGGDYRVNGEANLVAPLSRRLAIKLGYVVRFDNRTDPGVEKTDRFFTSGLQIAF